MKIVFKYFTIVVILLLIINCKTKTVEPTFENNPEQLKRVWMLVEFQNFKKEELIINEAQMNFTDLKNTFAKMGCNQISFSIDIKKNKIKFLNSIRTEMYCEKKMELEDTFLKSLSETYSYIIKGQTLTLFNSKNEKIVFVAQDWD
jgi:heat shock protein HslJ